MLLSPRTFLAALLPTVAFGAESRNTSEPFHLFVYGKGLGGLPVFYSKSLAYAGNPKTSFPTDSNADVVQFLEGPKNTWFGSPTIKKTDWTAVSLFVPATASEVTTVGFITSKDTQGNSSIETTGFSWYGQTAMRIEDDGTIDTKFTALRLSNGAVQLYWADTSLGQIPVTLRSRPPTNFVNATALII